MPSIENYLLGTDTTEAQRLGIQHRLWAAQASAIWEKAAIGAGSRVLDIGCGPGFAAADLAELVGPAGKVLGIEGSPAYIDHFVDRMANLGYHHAEVRRADIHALAQVAKPAAEEQTPFFDAAYCRWVLSFSNDVATVFNQIHQCLKPGGRIVIQDYFNWRSMSLAPRVPAFTKGVQAIIEYWEAHDGSNDVMAEVPRLLREQGFTLTHFQPTLRNARPTDPLWAWPDSFWPSIIPRVTEAGYLTTSQAADFFAAWREASTNPDVFIALPPVIDAIAIKA